MNGAVTPATCEYTDFQLQQLNTLQTWINMQVEFRGRTDEDFLLIFLHGCKFDLEKAKKKITMYYENRKNFPQWWANRDIREPNLQSLLQLKMTTLLINKDPHQPSVAFSTLSKFGRVDNNFDLYIKMLAILLETLIRRRNSQLNGIIWVIDCAGYPFWFVKRFMSPILVYNIVHCFYLAMPLKVKSINLLNTDFIASTIWAIAKPIVPPKLRKRVNFYKSDWSQLYDGVPVDILPEEYGGLAGPLSVHEDAFLDEINSLTEYFNDDNKYGFTT